MPRKAATTDKAKPKRGRPRKVITPEIVPANKRIPSIDQIKRDMAKNPLMTQAERAKLYGVSKQALNAALKRHHVDTEMLPIYKQHRADIFAGKQEMVLSELTPEVVKRWTDKAPMAAVTLFNSLFNNERLERGQSTSNAAVVIASACRGSLEEE